MDDLGLTGLVFGRTGKILRMQSIEYVNIDDTKAAEDLMVALTRLIMYIYYHSFMTNIILHRRTI